MEYLQGQTLSARIFESGPLPLEETLNLLFQLGLALRTVHQQGIVSSRFKAGEYFLTENGRALCSLEIA